MEPSVAEALFSVVRVPDFWIISFQTRGSIQGCVSQNYEKNYSSGHCSLFNDFER